MPEVMFEIVDDVLGEVETVNIERLKQYTLNVAQTNGFELVDKEGWIEFINPGVKLELGHALESFKECLSEDTVFALCTQILSVVGMDLYRVIGKNIKEKIDWTAVLPGSEYDDDQVLYQMGFDSSCVSSIAVYVDNKHIASYGSRVVGEQDVRYYKGENGEPVPTGEGEEEQICKDPKILHKLRKLQKETGEEYLYYANNCWLECFFEGIDGSDLSRYSDQLQADAEYVHGSISEGFGIEQETLQEIIKSLKGK